MLQIPEDHVELSPTPPHEPDVLPTELPLVPEQKPDVPLHHPEPAFGFRNALRTLVQILVVFLCLFLVVRTIFVEPFGVPTGSMAPTLYGNHRAAPCPRCGYSICVGSPTADERGKRDFLHPQVNITCPNCGKQGLNLTVLSNEIAGDRLLVDKTAFEYRKPRRWEVAVFRCPVDDAKPYVKRIVGLPGERMRVFDGDVFANDQLLRKNWDEIRDCRIPLFDMNFVPETKTGWTPRWIVEPPVLSPEEPQVAKLPLAANLVQDSTLVLDATGEHPAFGITYANMNLDTNEAEVIRDTLTYNGGVRRAAPLPIHDFILECDVEVVAGTGLLGIRLGDGTESMRVDLPVGTDTQTPMVLAHDGEKDEFSTKSFRMVPGKRYHIAFAFVDRRALLAIDGNNYFPAFDLPGGLRERSGTDRPLQFGVRGISVVVHNLKLYRDIFYRSESNAPPGGRKYALGASEYFALGDNSANSSDSRDWKDAKGRDAFGISESAFIGKPFLIHQPLKAERITANGKDWKVQVVDWDRLRLLN